GRHLCDAFHLVPPGDHHEFVDAMCELAEREEVDVVLPQSSYDLEGLADRRSDFGDTKVLVSEPSAIALSNEKAACFEFLHGLGLPVPEFRRVRGASGVQEAAHELGYPDRPLCFKPVISSGSRGFHVLDSRVDRAAQLLTERPGSVAMRLEEALGLLPEDGP